jgi:hypothetical protein
MCVQYFYEFINIIFNLRIIYITFIRVLQSPIDFRLCV